MQYLNYINFILCFTNCVTTKELCYTLNEYIPTVKCNHPTVIVREKCHLVQFSIKQNINTVYK